MTYQPKYRRNLPPIESNQDGGYWKSPSGLQFHADHDGVGWTTMWEPALQSNPRPVDVPAVIRELVTTLCETHSFDAYAIVSGNGCCLCDVLAEALIRHGLALARAATFERSKAERKKLHEILLSQLEGGKPYVIPTAIEADLLNAYLMMGGGRHESFVDLITREDADSKLIPVIRTSLKRLSGAGRPRHYELRIFVGAAAEAIRGSGQRVTHSTFKEKENTGTPQSETGRLIVELLRKIGALHGNTETAIASILRECVWKQ